ncbi:PDZ domain-containing protein [Streptomyces sp. NPDC021608]|uniref:PDZ domain-containing protein n=1 Tax=Streptomyces sp. NPDC021608 TaxID=3154903 RepID=UPI0033FD0E77
MEQTALRPKPMPGQERRGRTGPGDPVPRPPAAHRRGGRRTTLLFGLFAGAVLVLSGVGLGVVGTAVIGRGGPGEPLRQAGAGIAAAPAGRGGDAGRAVPSATSAPAPPSGPSPRPARATLGLEAVDARTAGARIVAVHVPGPGFTAGLVRGDVLVRFDGAAIHSATDLARRVDATRPGRAVRCTVCRPGAPCRQATVTPGVVT